MLEIYRRCDLPRVLSPLLKYVLLSCRILIGCVWAHTWRLGCKASAGHLNARQSFVPVLYNLSLTLLSLTLQQVVGCVEHIPALGNVLLKVLDISPLVPVTILWVVWLTQL